MTIKYLVTDPSTYNQVLEDDGVLVQKEKKHLLNLLSELAESAQVYPKAFELSSVECDLRHPVASGGFSAAFRENIGGQVVCVKAARVSLLGDNERSLKVSLIRPYLDRTGF